MTEENIIRIDLPKLFDFGEFTAADFDEALSIFDWSVKDRIVEFNYKNINPLGYQGIALIEAYKAFLRSRGCTILLSGTDIKLWSGLPDKEELLNDGDESLDSALFKSNPSFLIENSSDRARVLAFAEKYLKDLDIELVKTIRYLLNELLYNTLEHGKNDHNIPSLLVFWVSFKSEFLSFHLVDVGVGIRKHLRQTYPNLGTDSEAVQYALKPQVSGTFGSPDTGYGIINNAGVGLYFSSNIIRRLRGNMFIVSGNGYVHVANSGIIAKDLEHQWNGTSVWVTLKLDLIKDLNLQKMIAEITKSISKAVATTEDRVLYLNIRNYFGRYAEDKDKAKKIRRDKILPALAANMTLTLDFEDIESAPHSLLNAMLATPIERLGLAAYKKIKIINATPDIRETLDFIFDDNTSTSGK